LEPGKPIFTHIPKLKKKPLKITTELAKALVLSEQGLIDPAFPKGKKGVLHTIQQLGYLQIDTLNVVARSHHHTLWSRLPDYQESFLNELLEKDKSIFEYWSHAASYLPMSDYRFSLPAKKIYADGKSHWFAKDKKMTKYVLDKIRAEGPLQSKDFEFKRNTPGNWYDWKPAKKALEQLFMEGKLMVAKRHNFQKVYDLTERVLPPGTDTSMPSVDEFAVYLIKKAIQAYGIVSENEVSYLRKGLKEAVSKGIKKMLKKGELLQVEVESLKEHYLISPEKLHTLEKWFDEQVDNVPATPCIHFLSPFDNAVIQRKRLSNLFKFDFNIECYLPEAKRKFGYWCLPILYNNRFIGRFDPKADRGSKKFYVKSMHFEKGFAPDIAFNKAFAEKAKLFASFNSCNKIIVQKADKSWKKQISAAF
jgi:uncharacterized protein YcaQ